MLRNPKWSYVQRRLFSADHVSNQLPGKRTEADEEPALRLFSNGTETCSECGGSTGRYQVCVAEIRRKIADSGKNKKESTPGLSPGRLFPLN
jgi:hypothetical protein